MIDYIYSANFIRPYKSRACRAFWPPSRLSAVAPISVTVIIVGKMVKLVTEFSQRVLLTSDRSVGKNLLPKTESWSSLTRTQVVYV